MPLPAGRLGSALVIGLLVAACHPRNPRPALDVAPARTAEDSVYVAVLEPVARALPRGRPLLVVPDVGAIWTRDADAREAAAGMSGAMSRTSPVLALAYARANMRARRLRLPATIAGHRVVARSRDPDAREAVQHYHTVTRAGFSTRGDTALVTVSALCGMLCGSGETVLVVRTPRGWRRGATVSFLNY